MPVDRRTFVLGSGAAVVGAALASLAIAGVDKEGEAASMATVTAGPSFELRIVGWDRSDDRPPLASMPAGETAGWIAIDPHWRGGWH